MTKETSDGTGDPPRSPSNDSSLSVMDLPPPVMMGGIPLMRAFSRRRSQRTFASRPLSYQVLSNTLWAAFGINRASTQGRTAPSAIDSQEVDIYATLATGAYLYEPFSHSLQLINGEDLRSITGYQDLVEKAPLNLVYVYNEVRAQLIPLSKRESYASASAGAIAQNVYLYSASEGLATVVRAWFDRDALGAALMLPPDSGILFAQSVGYPSSERHNIRTSK